MKTNSNSLESGPHAASYDSAARHKGGVVDSRIHIPKSGIQKKNITNFMAYNEKFIFINAILNKDVMAARLNKKLTSSLNDNLMDNLICNSLSLTMIDEIKPESIFNKKHFEKISSSIDKKIQTNIDYITILYLKALILPTLCHGDEKANSEEKNALEALRESDVIEIVKCIQAAINDNVKKNISHKFNDDEKKLFCEFEKKFRSEEWKELNEDIFKIIIFNRIQRLVVDPWHQFFFHAFADARQPLKDFVYS